MRWVSVGMLATGVILMIVSWHTMGTQRRELLHLYSRGRTATPFVTAVPLPVASEPLVPTRTSTPLARVGPLSTLDLPSSSMSDPTVSSTHRATIALSPERTKVAVVPAFPTPSSFPTRRTEPIGASGLSSTSPGPTERSGYLPMRARFGIGVAVSSIEELDPSGRVGAGWYLNWGTTLHPSHPEGMEFVQMIRVKDGYHPDLATITAVASANPGSLWLIGNEPDVRWQDNATPEEYARVYHGLYTFLKQQDPTCKVAIGGVSQPTPLRLQYLDTILENYQRLYGERMPIDVWNVHAFILREERNSWGVDIPPGMSAARGVLYEVQDHDNLRIFARQIVAFRRWMRDKGERNKPLIVSEYGILMPEDYGFPFERVRGFMYETFNYLLTARDEELGYPPDDNQLVQRWAWYSLGDTRYPMGNLIDPDTKELTPLGLAYREFVKDRLSFRHQGRKAEEANTEG